MADPKSVPVEVFVTTIKILASQISELTVSVMTLRAALLQANSLPVSADEMERLDKFFRNWEPIRRAQEAMENAGANTNEEDLLALLRNFEGPIQ